MARSTVFEMSREAGKLAKKSMLLLVRVAKRGKIPLQIFRLKFLLKFFYFRIQVRIKSKFKTNKTQFEFQYTVLYSFFSVAFANQSQIERRENPKLLSSKRANEAGFSLCLKLDYVAL